MFGLRSNFGRKHFRSDTSFQRQTSEALSPQAASGHKGGKRSHLKPWCVSFNSALVPPPGAPEEPSKAVARLIPISALLATPKRFLGAEGAPAEPSEAVARLIPDSAFPTSFWAQRVARFRGLPLSSFWAQRTTRVYAKQGR